MDKSCYILRGYEFDFDIFCGGQFGAYSGGLLATGPIVQIGYL